MFGNTTAVQSNTTGRFLAKAYGYMSLTLAVSFVTAFGLLESGHVVLGGLPNLVLFLASFGLIVLIAHASSFAVKLGGLMLFAVVDGATLTGMLAFYAAFVPVALVASCVDFGTMSLIGLRSKRDFATLGRQVFAAMIGLVVTEVVMFLLSALHVIAISPLMMLVLSAIVVVVFSLSTIYDSRKLVRTAQNGMGSDSMAINGALQLYLDFINIFVSLLQIFILSDRDD